ncbi:hypothetical protein LCGC14_2296950, partial [marine sediment metagenome]
MNLKKLNFKPIICKDCKQKKKHKAHGLCGNCYSRFQWSR